VVLSGSERSEPLKTQLAMCRCTYISTFRIEIIIDYKFAAKLEGILQSTLSSDWTAKAINSHLTPNEKQPAFLLFLCRQ
jgi:hypothetical protein